MGNFGKMTALKDEMTPMLAFIAVLSSCGAWTFGWGELHGLSLFDNG